MLTLPHHVHRQALLNRSDTDRNRKPPRASSLILVLTSLILVGAMLARGIPYLTSGFFK